jgi:D-sedoheptulose 7-phosphate isomerase
MKKQLATQINLLQYMIESDDLNRTVNTIIHELSGSLFNGLPLLLFGNGGSAADALHISGELVGKFHENRKALNVLCLNSNAVIMTAWSNDFSYDSVFERQVQAHGIKGGFAWGISTSGNSKSVILGLRRAQAIGMRTIGMTGSSGGSIKDHSDFLINVPTSETPRVQELHLPIYHYICQEVEKKLFQSSQINQ